jgi:hypothetical protein
MNTIIRPCRYLNDPIYWLVGDAHFGLASLREGRLN